MLDALLRRYDVLLESLNVHKLVIFALVHHHVGVQLRLIYHNVVVCQLEVNLLLPIG